jgi:cupin fold WbuC family metalloprotein
MSVAFFNNDKIIEITAARLAWLKEQAKETSLGRARLCLHHSPDETIQEMVIAFRGDSYIRPHRHVETRESFHVIEGLLTVFFFEDDGSVSRRLDMGPLGSDKPFLYRLSANLWHTVVPRTEEVVIHETTLGPFRRERTQYPLWAPADGDLPAIEDFLAKIRG